MAFAEILLELCILCDLEVYTPERPLDPQKKSIDQWNNVASGHYFKCLLLFGVDIKVSIL